MADVAGVRWRKMVADDSVRLVTGRPRRIPRRKREEIASILAQELIGAKDTHRSAGRQGAFYLLVSELKATEEWSALQAMAAKSNIISTLSLRSLTATALDVLDRSIVLPSNNEAECSLGGLIALTAVAWRRNSTVGEKELSRAVEEFGAADAKGEGRAALRAALRGALAPVVEEMQKYAEMLEMMKRMLPSGDDEAFVEEVFLAYMKNVGRMAELLKRSEELQKIIDLMGRLDVEYGARQEKAKNFTTSEAYDLGLSKDVRHVLPVELLKLKVPILQVLFFSQMLEGELLTYQLRGLDWTNEPDAKRGPVIALIDASGSMSGEPELIAKAFILMLAKRMEREGRDIKVILFAAADWKLEISLVNKKKVAQNLLDTMCRHFEGYTDFNSALRVGLDTVKGKQWRGADVLFFTDGESEVSDQSLVRDWNEFKRRTGSKIYTLIVNSTTAGGLEMVSDHLWTLPTGTWKVEGSPSNIIRLIAGEDA